VSAKILPESNRDSKYTDRVRRLLDGNCPPSIAGQIIDIVAGLEAALHRQAQDEIDVELRLTEVEENILRRLDEITRTLEDRTK